MDDLEIKESFSNCVGAVEQEIEVLVKAQEIAVQSRENLPKEISQREAERHILELTLALALKKINENKILCEDKNALELLVRKKEASKHAMRLKFQAEKDKWNDLSNVRAVNLAGKLKKMESEMKGKLLEKEVLMDYMQKKNEADRLQLKEAHKELNALKLEVQRLTRPQAEGRHEPFSTEVLECKPNVSYVPTAVAQEIQQLPQARRISLRDNWPNVAADHVPVKPQGSKESVLGHEARKIKKQRSNLVDKNLEANVSPHRWHVPLRLVETRYTRRTLQTQSSPPQNYLARTVCIADPRRTANTIEPSAELPSKNSLYS